MTTSFLTGPPGARSDRSALASTPRLTTADRGAAIVLATQGLGASRTPTVLARLLAARLHRPLHVVSVIEPVVVYGDAAGLGSVPMVLNELYASDREETVREALAESWATDLQYALEIRLGSVSREIAAAAREVGASYVVVGAAPHRRRKHVISGVLAAQVLRSANCPVLSVAPGFDHMPQRVLVAVDFSAASIRAAREALRLLDDAGTLTLAYAIPMIHAERLLPTLAKVVGPDEAMRMLERLRDHLKRSAPAGTSIELRVLDGIADDQILDLAASMEADLIAVGTHGPGVFERMFIGSVASNILHGAACSVLAAPSPGAIEQAELDLDAWGTAESVDEPTWERWLDDFSTRNAGRSVRVEVDDLAFGAQVQATGYILHGTVFDPRDRRVDVMLGSPKEPDAHLTRIISRVRSIARTCDSAGRDSALQIRSESGDTLIIFDR